MSVRRLILVVDDDEDSAELLADTLRGQGHDARVAHDGQHALDVIASFVPDLALVDIGLPDIDGYELARRFRDLPALHAMRLVALTGYNDRERTLAAGFDELLVKPVRVDRVVSSIERCV